MEDFDNDDDDTTTTRPGPQLSAERPDDPDPNTRWSSRLGGSKLSDGGSEYSPAESAALRGMFAGNNDTPSGVAERLHIEEAVSEAGDSITDELSVHHQRTTYQNNITINPGMDLRLPATAALAAAETEG
eukprot:1757574-Prymnesium_polylepis.1